MSTACAYLCHASSHGGAGMTPIPASLYICTVVSSMLLNFTMAAGLHAAARSAELVCSLRHSGYAVLAGTPWSSRTAMWGSQSKSGTVDLACDGRYLNKKNQASLFSSV